MNTLAQPPHRPWCVDTAHDPGECFSGYQHIPLSLAPRVPVGYDDKLVSDEALLALAADKHGRLQVVLHRGDDLDLAMTLPEFQQLLADGNALMAAALRAYTGRAA